VLLPVNFSIQQGIPAASLDNGSVNLPPAPQATTNLASISVTDGVITATGTAVAPFTYILTPDLTGSSFAITGSCVNAGVCPS